MKNNKRETLLVVLVGMLAGVILYTKGFDVSHQLVPAVYSSSFVPADINFRSDVLVSEQQFDFASFSAVPTQPQVEAKFLDETHPAPVEEFTALNTHVGKEVALFWKKPEGVQAVNIYRQQKNSDGTYSKEELIAEAVQEDTAMDTTVEDRVEYRYSARSVNIVGKDDAAKTYLAATAPVSTVISVDDIPPRAPSNVQVETIDVANAKQLHITWEKPADDDFSSVIIYRSEQIATRGEKIAEVEKNAVPEYTDSDAQPNVTYYYTVVAYDDSGNGSSADFSIPNPGNTNPFSPEANRQ